MLVQPLILVSFRVDIPNWLFSTNTLVGIVIGLIPGLVIGRISR